MLAAVLFYLACVTLVQGQQYSDVTTAATKLKLTTFVKVLSAADMGSDLSSSAWIGTAFLPSEAGWGLLTKTWNMSLAEILKNPVLCKAIIQQHIVPRIVVRLGYFPRLGALPTALVTQLSGQGLSAGRDAIPSTSGSSSLTYFYVQGLMNRAVLDRTSKDLNTARGVVHVVNVALVPDLMRIPAAKPSLAFALDAYNKTAYTVLAYINGQPQLSDLAKAISVVGPLARDPIGSTSSRFTYFAPTNAAFVSAARSMGFKNPKSGLGDVSRLLTKPNLSQILDGLIVRSGTMTPKDLVALKTLATGPLGDEKKLLVNNLNGNVTLSALRGTAKIVSPPIYISEAVLYLVDNLIINF